MLMKFILFPILLLSGFELIVTLPIGTERTGTIAVAGGPERVFITEADDTTELPHAVVLLCRCGREASNHSDHDSMCQQCDHLDNVTGSADAIPGVGQSTGPRAKPVPEANADCHTLYSTRACSSSLPHNATSSPVGSNVHEDMKRSQAEASTAAAAIRAIRNPHHFNPRHSPDAEDFPPRHPDTVDDETSSPVAHTTNADNLRKIMVDQVTNTARDTQNARGTSESIADCDPTECYCTNSYPASQPEVCLHPTT